MPEIARFGNAVCCCGKFASPVGDIPPKPKGMHHTTYQRMCTKLMHAQDRNNDLFGEALRRIAARVDTLTKEWDKH